MTTPTVYLWTEKVQPDGCTFSQRVQRLWDTLPDTPENKAYLDELCRRTQPPQVRCQRLTALGCFLQTVAQVCPSLLPRMSLARHPDKRPFVHISGENPPPLSFSLTHTHTLTVCALLMGEARIGVDAEPLIPEERAIRLANRFFTREEQALLQADGDVSRAATRIWTAKEALFKCGGQASVTGCNSAMLPQGYSLLTGMTVEDQTVISLTAPSGCLPPEMLYSPYQLSHVHIR